MSKESWRKSRENLRFGGNREIVIQRDGEKCRRCGMTREEHYKLFGRDITVDHINNLGRRTPVGLRDNSLNNLETLCLPCHGKKDHRKSKKLLAEGATSS
jgi:5-methylcytosine-specific restriction endonuclease McrA